MRFPAAWVSVALAVGAVAVDVLPDEIARGRTGSSKKKLGASALSADKPRL